MKGGGRGLLCTSIPFSWLVYGMETEISSRSRGQFLQAAIVARLKKCELIQVVFLLVTPIFSFVGYSAASSRGHWQGMVHQYYSFTAQVILDGRVILVMIWSCARLGYKWYNKAIVNFIAGGITEFDD